MGKRNRILLAMSVLPDGDKQFDSFQRTISKENRAKLKFINGNECELNYGSQLEPAVLYILNQLADDGLEIDILCTDSTYSKKNSSLNVSAVEYFTQAICKYIGADSENLGIDQECFKNANSYLEIERDRIKFVYIKVDEKRPDEGIFNTVNYIRNNRYDNSYFWIDTHGGFRDISLTLNAIISLLEVYDIRPDGILGVRYESGVCEVVNQDQSYEMFDFVSGMNEFIRFGSADYLVEHYKEKADADLNELILAMKRISDGTRLCDPNEYICGLDDLAKAINGAKTSDLLFNIFIDYIKSDYGDLLDARKRTTLGIVSRCVNKKLYQQALTFIESKMPEEIINGKVIYYDENDIGNRSSIANAKGINTFESDNNVFFNAVTGNTDYFKERVADRKWIDFCNSKRPLSMTDIVSSIIGRKDYLALKCLEECLTPNNYDDRLWKTVQNRGGNIVYLSRHNNDPVRICTDISDVSKRKKAAHLLRLHNSIKRCRNMVNHSSERMRPDMDTIAKALVVYVELAKEVLY